MEALTLHEDPCSGNCYKIKLTAALLGQPLAIKQYDILKGETRTPEFLARVNAHGRIPVLQVGERFLPESNAACWFIADGSTFISRDRFERAEMLRWMFFEQYSHEPNIATMRFWTKFVGMDNLSPEQSALVPTKRKAGAEALALMDDHLADRQWLAGQSATLADIVLFAYTHIAGEGGFDLESHSNIGRWIDGVRSLPDFAAMESS